MNMVRNPNYVVAIKKFKETEDDEVVKRNI